MIDYSEFKKNRSVSGMIAAMQGFFVKFGMGVAALAMGLIMKLGGYIPNVEQTESSLFSIEVCFLWLPILICVGIMIAISFYHLDSIREEMTQTLETRRKQLAFAAQE